MRTLLKVLLITALAGLSALLGLWINAPQRSPAVLGLPNSSAVIPALVPKLDRPPRGTAVRIRPGENRRPIDDYVYGSNYHVHDKHTTRLRYPIVRWGGNATTRYNWKENTSNRGADWFFENIPDEYYEMPGKDRVGITDMVILRHKPVGTEVLFTLPTIGWTPKDRARRPGFSVAKYGPQAEVDPYFADAGNGVGAAGQPITANDPADTSMRIDPQWNVDWIAHMQELLGTSPGGSASEKGGMRLFALDNEPDLWNATHRDVRQGDAALKSPHLSFEELWRRTVEYAGAIKKAEPKALITGPVVWGWCNYFGSAVDVNDGDGDCRDGKDRRSQGGEPLLKWYARQVCEHEKRTGIRLVDYLDVHFYPEGLDLSSEAPEVARDRLQRLRALYDPAYVDPSWIKEPVMLIPRLKKWLAEACPSLKLAISEYRFGYDQDGASAALAQAEALAIFGREGVDLATTWGEIAADSRYEDAFRLYLDYDGRGSSALGGTSVQALSASSDSMPAYAIETKQALLVYLFNKSDVAPAAAEVSVDGRFETLEFYRLSQDERLGAVTTGVPTAPDERGAFLVTLPARSVTLAVLKRR